MCFTRPFGCEMPRWMMRFNRVAFGLRRSRPTSRTVASSFRYRSDDAVRTMQVDSGHEARRTRRTSSPRTPRKTRSGRKNGRWRTLFSIFFVFLIVGVVGFALLEIKLKPSIMTLAKAKAQIAATEAVNRTLSEKIASQMRYEDMMIWKTDGNGNIVAIQPNTSEINRVTGLTTVKIQEALKDIPRDKVAIPLGYVFGNDLLASMGPWLSIAVLNVGTVNTSVHDTFESTGINQIRHRIYMDIEASMDVVIPSLRAGVVVKTSMPIAEAIILGDVPQYYVNIGSGNDLAGSGVSLKSVLPEP